MTGSRADLEAAQRSFDKLFRRDAGATLAQWFAEDAQLLFPEEAPITGPVAIGRAFAEFAMAFETISFEPVYDLVEVEGPLAVVMGTFIKIRRSREEPVVQRVHGRVVYTWRLDNGSWRCTRLMTSRYAPNEVVGE